MQKKLLLRAVVAPHRLHVKHSRYSILLPGGRFLLLAPAQKDNEVSYYDLDAETPVLQTLVSLDGPFRSAAMFASLWPLDVAAYKIVLILKYAGSNSIHGVFCVADRCIDRAIER